MLCYGNITAIKNSTFQTIKVTNEHISSVQSMLGQIDVVSTCFSFVLKIFMICAVFIYLSFISLPFITHEERFLSFFLLIVLKINVKAESLVYVYIITITSMCYSKIFALEVTRKTTLCCLRVQTKKMQ